MKLREIRALSITQPWAECMLSEGKNVENRTWNTGRRGYIAIHASSSYDKKRFNSLKENYGVEIDPSQVEFGVIVGFAKLIDVVTEDGLSRHTKKWFEGDYGFVFEDVIKLKNPVPVRGTLNFWKLSGNSLTKCLSQLNSSQIKRIAGQANN